MMRVKKNDTVVVLTGKDKDKKGTVLDVSPKEGKVLVSGIAIAVHHQKARKQGQASQIKKQESYIQLCNVMPVCSSCNKPCRVNVKLTDGDKVRICGRCKEKF
ncbi:50S ribosomal protein L24 [Candidatus Dependentiae bacterium]|nr:50S ribosomal protein L24 [Candidatus Dependentiae bacterium]